VDEFLIYFDPKLIGFELLVVLIAVASFVAYRTLVRRNKKGN
jgi:hypothetical protein